MDKVRKITKNLFILVAGLLVGAIAVALEIMLFVYSPVLFLIAGAVIITVVVTLLPGKWSL